MDDLISRQKAIEIIDSWLKCNDYNNAERHIMRAMQSALYDLPPVTPKQSEWIPVSEKLPKEGKTVIASTKYGVYPEAKYTKEDGWLWAYESGADYWVELENVTAWMPLPTKYKPQESEGV